MTTLARIIASQNVRPPRLGTRAAGSRETASGVDVRWKNPVGKEFRDKIRSCENDQGREELAETMMEALYPLLDAAAACGELNVEIRLPAGFDGGTEVPVEAFLVILRERLDRDGYRLFRPGEIHGVGLGAYFTETLLVCW